VKNLVHGLRKKHSENTVHYMCLFSGLGNKPKITPNKKKKSFICLAKVIILAGGIFSTHSSSYQSRS